MISSSIRYGSLRGGMSVMKFILTYEGELRSNARADKKWDIRKALHPQLMELWEIHPSLKEMAALRYVPKGVFPLMGAHHTERKPFTDDVPPPDHIDLLEPVVRKNRRFYPLVRNSMRLQCALKILFLRKEPPGKVYQGGDLDNRLKTLFDALSVPTMEQVIDENDDEMIYCLLEDDSLISGINIETQRLLSRPNASHHDVQLTIEVDIQVTAAEPYNFTFLAD